MKALIVTFVSLWMGSIPLWTIENQNLSQNRVAIATDDEEEDIPLYVIKKEAANPFSLFQPTAYATLSNKIVSIDLSELSEEDRYHYPRGYRRRNLFADRHGRYGNRPECLRQGTVSDRCSIGRFVAARRIFTLKRMKMLRIIIINRKMFIRNK